MPLSKEEQEQFDALEKKRNEPEPSANGGGRSESVNITIDLSDEAAVERAIKHGYLTQAEVDELEDEETAEEEDPPRRRSRYD